MLSGKKLISGNILPLLSLVKEITPEEKTESGLIIKPVNVMAKSNISGEVVLVGGSTPTEEMHIKVGHKILFSPNAFRKFVHPDDNKEYLLVHQKDVMLFY
jgi:co-chaperonin GroES (HSP10)